MTHPQQWQPQGRFALVNGKLILPQRITSHEALIIDEGKIIGTAEVTTLGRELEKVDVAGRYIAPGLIDIHTHGVLGHRFNEPTAEAFTTIAQENARRGVTGLLATTSTAPISNLLECLAFGQHWMGQQQDGAQVLGFHVEGPYFSLAQSGAQDPANIRNPDDGTPEQLLAYHNIIKIMTFAPELPGALDLTRKLIDLGIVPAAGHSSAKEEEVAEAISLGLGHIIHIWSSQSTTVREGPWRKPGLLEVSLTHDNLTVEMIADNKHLPPTLMKLAYKCIGPERLCIISDAIEGAGLAEGTRWGGTCGAEREVRDGVGILVDGSSFAGSTTLLNQMIPILTNTVGVPLVEAVRMASLNPARVIKMDDRKGSLEPGKDADVAVFNDDFTAWRTMIGGRWVYADDQDD